MLKAIVCLSLVFYACGGASRNSLVDARLPAVDVSTPDVPDVGALDARSIDAVVAAETGPLPFDAQGGDTKDDAKDGATVDARLPDGSADVGNDASDPLCGGTPLPAGGVRCMPVTPEVLACFACPHPRTTLCASVCSSSGCYDCVVGKWSRSEVDCFPCVDAAADVPYDAGADVSIDTRDGGGDGSAMDGRTD